MIGLEYGIKWTTLINDNFLFSLNRLAYSLALPSLLFYKIAKVDFSSGFNISLVVGLAIVFNAYGEKGLATAGVVLGFIVPAFNFFSIVALLLPNREGRLPLMVFIRQILLSTTCSLMPVPDSRWSISQGG